MNPKDTLKLEEKESLLWAEAQTTVIQWTTQIRRIELITLPSILGRWCFTYGSWKDHEKHSGQGRDTISPFHSEVEALIWAMECMKNLHQFQVTFATDCSQLVKMVSEPGEWSAFANYLEDIKIMKASFHTSELIIYQER